LYGDWTPQQEIDNPVSMIPDSLFRILHFTIAILNRRTLLPATGLQDPFPERLVIAPAQFPVLQRIFRFIAVRESEHAIETSSSGLRFIESGGQARIQASHLGGRRTSSVPPCAIWVV